MAGKCKYPVCNKAATKSWALVDLCDLHHEGIRNETNRYYNGKGATQLKDEERQKYFSIVELIPWSRKR